MPTLLAEHSQRCEDHKMRTGKPNRKGLYKGPVVPGGVLDWGGAKWAGMGSVGENNVESQTRVFSKA